MGVTMYFICIEVIITGVGRYLFPLLEEYIVPLELHGYVEIRGYT